MQTRKTFSIAYTLYSYGTHAFYSCNKPNTFFAGGSPYPLLNNADFVALLKTGYRMEKPDLCSDDL